MEHQHSHTVLVVDDEAMVGKAVTALLRKMEVQCVCAGSGAEALEILSGAAKAFSMVISDQRMPAMTGQELLERVRELFPDTLRFLISGYTDMAVIMRAVNTGVIHRYIPKPWDNAEFARAIADGLKQYELSLENERLSRLAREQNQNPHKLNKELKSRADEDKGTRGELDQRIEALTRKLTAMESAAPGGQGPDPEEPGRLMRSHGVETKEKAAVFLDGVVQEIFVRFQELAARNGFEMPGEF